MLKSFNVRNFQSLANLTVSFSPTVTTIVGPNDKGKSAFMRALQLVCLNKLSRSPDAYIRHGSSKLNLKLKVDKHTIVRKKGKGVNSYTIDGKRLEAFGKGKVPEKIEEILNVGRENFQKQHDNHFWFSDTAGQVSRHLNEMVNLGLIDKSLTNLASEVKKAKGDLEIKSDTLKQSRARLKELDWVPTLNAKLKELEALKAARDKAARNAQELELRVQAMRTLLEQRNARKREARAGNRAVAEGQRLKELRGKVKRLEGLLAGLNKASAILKIQIPDIKPLQEFRAKADAVAEKWRRLKYLVEDLTNLEKQIWTLKGEIEAKDTTLAKAAKNRRCSKCGRLLKRSSSQTFICNRSHQSVGKRKVSSGTT